MLLEVPPVNCRQWPLGSEWPWDLSSAEAGTRRTTAIRRGSARMSMTAVVDGRVVSTSVARRASRVEGREMECHRRRENKPPTHNLDAAAQSGCRSGGEMVERQGNKQIGDKPAERWSRFYAHRSGRGGFGESVTIGVRDEYRLIVKRRNSIADGNPSARRRARGVMRRPRVSTAGAMSFSATHQVPSRAIVEKHA